METSIVIILTVLVLNFLIILFSNKLIRSFNVYDYPNSNRKFHKKKTSLLGGTIIFVNLLLFYLLNLVFKESIISNIYFSSFIIGSTLFYLLGLLDDKKDLNSNLKFIIEILIIIFLIFIDKNLLIKKIYFSSLDISINLGNYSYIFTVLCILIFLNALNMYDGINLQAGSYSLIIILCLFLFSKDNLLLTTISLSLITFLYFNYKSKIFLGDNGTYLLGFIISYLIIYTAKETNYLNLSADKIFVLMMLPGLELIRLFVYRLRLKRHPFSSDRNHIHHILLEKFGYKNTIIFLIFSSILPILLMLLIGKYTYLLIFLFVLFYFFTINAYGK